MPSTSNDLQQRACIQLFNRFSEFFEENPSFKQNVRSIIRRLFEITDFIDVDEVEDCFFLFLECKCVLSKIGTSNNSNMSLAFQQLCQTGVTHRLLQSTTLFLREFHQHQLLPKGLQSNQQLWIFQPTSIKQYRSMSMDGVTGRSQHQLRD